MQTLALLLIGMGSPALADAAAPVPIAAPAAATVRMPAAAPRTISEFRLKPAVTGDANGRTQADAAVRMVQSGYGGITNLFPVAGGNLHMSAGGRLFGRAGRPRTAGDPESMRYMPALRGGGLRGGRRSPAMLVGYGRTVEHGLTFGVDAGMVMGRLGATPDRFGRLNRRRLESGDGRGRHMPTNEIARMTALYRF